MCKKKKLEKLFEISFDLLFFFNINGINFELCYFLVLIESIFLVQIIFKK